MPDPETASPKATEQQHAWVERTLGVDPRALAGTTMQGVVVGGSDYTDLIERRRALYDRVQQVRAEDQRGIGRLYHRAADAINDHHRDEATALMDQLAAALDRSEEAARHPVATPRAKPRPDAAKLTKAAAARDSWNAMLAKVNGELGELETSFMAAFRGHPQEGDLQRGFHERINEIKHDIDFRLGTAFDDAAKAADDDDYGRRIEEAREILKTQTALARTDTTLAALDANPFRPLALQKLLTATIEALEEAVT